MAKRGSKAPNYNDSTLSGRTQRQARIAQGLANARVNQAKQARTAKDNASEAVRTSTRRSRPNQQSTGQSVDRGGFRYTRFGD